MTDSRIKTLLASGLAAFFFAACAGSRSQLKVGKSVEGEVVEADGIAPYDSSDQIKSKRGSLVDAQRNAVEQAVGVFVSGRTLVDKAVAIQNSILAKTDGYIKKYDILKEGRDGEFYKTRIRALVAIKELQEDLSQMSLLNTPELKRPRVSVALIEVIDKADTTQGAAQSALQKVLGDQGFVVVSADSAQPPDLALKGKAEAFPFQSEGLGGFVSYRARLSVQALKPGTKNVVLSLTKEASGLGGNPELAGLKALESVGTLAGNEMATQLVDTFQKNTNVMVFVENAKTFSDVEKVRKHLAAQPGVSDLMLRVYDNQMAQFEVQLGSIQPAELASQLEGGADVGLKVMESKPDLIRLKLD